MWGKVYKYPDNQLVILHNLHFSSLDVLTRRQIRLHYCLEVCGIIRRITDYFHIISDYPSIRMINNASIDCLLAWLNQRRSHTIKANFRAHQIDSSFFTLCLWCSNTITRCIPLICIFCERIFLTANRIISRYFYPIGWSTRFSYTSTFVYGSHSRQRDDTITDVFWVQLDYIRASINRKENWIVR